MECPAPDIRQCRCKISSMLHSAYMSFYPRSGLLRYGEIMLFDVKHLDGFGVHFWEMVIHNTDDSSDREICYLPKHMVYYFMFTMRHNQCGRGGG